ncbi:phage tail protein [Bartonella bovis]|uniref:Putative phage tail fiber protein n=1 Tax=Bartonella bovis m02 TaxID=1094492 RepID=N6UI70_9HYPH|nr:phage tail protein [Bartonella bovis]ENN89938.1 putative phage tail fiber protein [Bartonella bovis m02]
MSSIYDWSLVAHENARVDEIINWAEGQPPSSVNDSARAMMQRIREYLTDNGGTIEAKFTTPQDENNTSIHLVTKSPIAAYTNDIVVRFKAPGVNAKTTSVMLNQLPAQPVYKVIQGGLVPLSGGEIRKGGLYELVYQCDIDGEDKNGWYLTNPTPAAAPKPVSNFPAGFIATFAMEKLPKGWLLCDGKAYLRENYKSLFAAIGETWGSGDKKTTFNVPDLRGMFLRGLDSKGEIDKGRVLGSRQNDAIKSHTHTGKIDNAGEHKHEFLQQIFSVDAARGSALPRYHNYEKRVLTKPAGNHTHTFTINKTGGTETRPVNVAVVYAIKV